nr:hypothetical protein [Chloroflexia bacterium]
VQEWNDTLTAKVRDYDDAAWVLDYTLVDAVNTGRLAREWLPITPRPNKVANPSFDTDLTSWTSVPGAGVAITWSRDTIAEPDAPAGSAKGIVSANSNGVNTILARLDSDSRLPVTPGRKYTHSAGARISTTNARPILAISYYTNAGGLIITYYEGFWSPVANLWVRRVFEAVAPATAAFMGAGLAVYGVTAGVLPTVWFDGVRLNGNILTWDALDGGPVVKVAWRQRYF